ncbi:MAG: alpha/beta fold hydrolase [Candidatus Binatia bacterium]|nr:alpha/beta fold hydrolase [Candidatus Binatia bacterium]
MLRMVVFVHGYDGSAPGHWQRWLFAELQRRGILATFPELPDPQWPECNKWVEQLQAIVAEAPTPVLFVAHSLGCWAIDHLFAQHGSRGVRAALLAAPPSPYLLFEPVQSFFPAPQVRSAWEAVAARSLLVTSDDDPYIEVGEAYEIAQRLGVPIQILPNAGHINIESGFGAWPFALEWVMHTLAQASGA